MLMAMVLNEEQRPISTAGGSRSSSKKNKQNKTPQRGMGVAQLEELRLREQQKTGASGLALPFLTASAAADPNPLLSRSSLPISSNGMNYFNNYQALPHTLEGSGDHSGFSTMLGNTEPCNHDSEAVARKYNLLASLQRDSPNTGGWRPPIVPQRRLQQQQFSMASKILSPSSSSGVSLQIEPPSNQSYRSNYPHIPAAWPDEEKVVGIKRPWPFHPDSLMGYGHTTPSRVPVFRESTSGSTTNDVDYRNYNHHHHSKSTADDGFLTLGPYMVPSISRSKHPFLPSHLPDYPTTLDFPSSQVSTDDGISQSRVSSEPPPFYCFLPVRPDSHETTSNERCGEALDTVDLNLKL